MSHRPSDHVRQGGGTDAETITVDANVILDAGDAEITPGGRVAAFTTRAIDGWLGAAISSQVTGTTEG